MNRVLVIGALTFQGESPKGGHRRRWLPAPRSRLSCSRGAQGINLTGSVLEALGIPARENHLGAFCTCTTCRFESDASATADDDNGVPKELRFTVDGRGDSAHASSNPASILPATLGAVRESQLALRVLRPALHEGRLTPRSDSRFLQPADRRPMTLVTPYKWLSRCLEYSVGIRVRVSQLASANPRRCWVL